MAPGARLSSRCSLPPVGGVQADAGLGEVELRVEEIAAVLRPPHDRADLGDLVELRVDLAAALPELEQMVGDRILCSPGLLYQY